MAHPSIEPGFSDAVGGSQSTFRSAMNALARPGMIQRFPTELTPPAPLFPPAAALLLTLCDFETPVWLDPPLAASSAVVEFLRFHTGAAIVEAPGEAAEAVVSDPSRMPPLSAFAQGTPQYPDRSATLILSVQHMSANGWTLEGPGIRDRITFSAGPLPPDFTAQVRANRAQFPRGVDIFFVTQAEIAALPRSSRPTEAD